MFLFGKSGFYVIQCDGLGTILVVEGDDQLVIVEINTIDESIDQPLAVRLLAQPHCGQGAGAGQSVPDHKHPHLGGDAGRPSGRPGRRRQTQECHSGYAVTKNSPPGNSRRQIFCAEPGQPLTFSKSEAGCLHSGQTKSAGSSSPS